ncbi:hypothetical protein EBR57_08980 [bacterium]|nr:hypothetical protein [bacterium]
MTFRVMFTDKNGRQFDEFTKFVKWVHYWFRWKLDLNQTEDVVVRIWPEHGESYSLGYEEFCRLFPDAS